MDVFFVISGFLITSLIMKDLEGGTFAFWNFWYRRARRILPALMGVVFFTIIAGWFVLLPPDFKDLGQASFAQAFFASNILFWLDTGYFAGPAESKALLHTWSLAVEEQFYLIAPFLLFLMFRYTRAAMLFIVLAGFALSLGISVYETHHAPSAAFYLLHARAWELLAGAALALVAPRLISFKNQITREVVSCAGLAAIAYAVLTFDKNTAFPGYAALLPVLGTVALIWANAGEKLTMIGRVLALKPLVWVGLISYSLYLWHWPLIVFARALSIDEPTITVMAGVLALSLVCAYLSYRYIETPVRKGAVLARPLYLFSASALALGLCAVLGLVLHFGKGVPQRFSEEVQVYVAAKKDTNPNQKRCHDASIARIENNDLCMSGPADAPKLLVWGDSHANALMPAIEAVAGERNVNVVTATRTASLPLLDVFRTEDTNPEKTKAWNRAVVDYIRRENVRAVLLIGRWAVNVEGREYEALDGGTSFPVISDNEMRSTSSGEARAVFGRNLPKTVRILQALGVEVFVMKQVPPLLVDVPIKLAQMERFGIEPEVYRLRGDINARMVFVNTVMDDLDEVEILDPADILCDQDKCSGQRDGRSLYSDDDHLSVYGAQFLRPLYDRVLNGF